MNLRKIKFSLLGMKIGKNVKIGAISVPIPEQVYIGENCDIEDNVRLRVGGPWKSGFIEIGYKSFIGHSTQINIGSYFKIGNNCLIAPNCIFSDAHHSFDDINTPINRQNCIYTTIEIGDDVWIGSGAIILGGVKIGNGSIVAAGSLVNKSIPPNEIWAGIPAKKIKNRQ